MVVLTAREARLARCLSAEQGHAGWPRRNRQQVLDGLTAKSLVMELLRGMSIPQRVVVVVGLAIAFLICWAWLYADDVQNAAGGWFAYAPIPDETWTDDYYIVRHLQLSDLAVALGFVAGWVALSIGLLGVRPRDDSNPEVQ